MLQKIIKYLKCVSQKYIKISKAINLHESNWVWVQCPIELSATKACLVLTCKGALHVIVPGSRVVTHAIF